MVRQTYQALLIDFYGTISSGDREAVEATSQRVVEDLALKIDPVEFSVDWGRRFFAAIETQNHEQFQTLYDIERQTLAETLAGLGFGQVDPTPYVDALVEYWAHPTLHPESLEALANLNLPVCCVSNADTADVLSAVEHHDLRFDHIITSEDARCYKPAPAIFEQALARLSLEPHQVVHAGDSLHADVQGARRMGITTVWVCRQGRIFDVGNSEPDHKISSLNELQDILC
ncbi:MAG: HAD family hydrolase [Phycisphaerae bacterium]